VLDLAEGVLSIFAEAQALATLDAKVEGLSFVMPETNEAAAARMRESRRVTPRVRDYRAEYQARRKKSLH
jgi:hypothetical protein